MDVNEETDILDRLGILDSKLECPNKQFPTPSKAKGGEHRFSIKKTSSPPSSSSAPVLEPGDGWSGLSLDESNSSSEDSDCLFERKDRSSVASGGRRRLRRHHRRGVGHHSSEFRGSPNCWKLFALLSVAAFMGFSMTLSHNSMSIPVLNKGSASPFSRFLASHALSLWVGSIFASSVLLRVNPFSVFFALMLILIGICVQIQMAVAVSETASIGHSVALFLCIAQAFVAGAIERGILLVSPLWTVRTHRVLFLSYATMALCASGAFFLQHNQSLGSIDHSFSSIPGSDHFAPIERHRREMFNTLSTTNVTVVPSFFEFDMNSNSSGEQEALKKLVYSSEDSGNKSSTNSTELTVTSASTEAQLDQPVFKTKTEENAFRRKEVEEKRKKEGKLKVSTTLATTMTPVTTTATLTTTTSRSTTTTTTTTTATTRKTTQSTTTTRTTRKAIDVTVTSPPPPSFFLAYTNVSSLLPTSSSSSRHVLFTLQFVVLCSFLIPLLLGFCCCCALDHPICSTQYRHLNEILKSSAHSAEPLLCHILSMSICAIHSALTAVMALAMPSFGISLPLFGTFSVPPSSLFWISLAFGRLIFAIRPSLASNSASLHSLYFISILACTVLHFVLPSSPFTLLLGVALSGFSTSNIPLLLYTWHCASAHSPLLSASGRFITAMAFGSLAGPMAFLWWIGSSENGQLSRPTFDPSSVFYFGFGVLSVSYALFLLLLTKLRRTKRQQQITQLSGALNGKPKRPPQRQKRRTNATKTKGPYKALLTSSTPADGDSRSTTLSLNVLESSSAESEVVDLEMDSIGEEEECQKNNNKKADERNRKNEISSVDDLV